MDLRQKDINYIIFICLREDFNKLVVFKAACFSLKGEENERKKESKFPAQLPHFFFSGSGPESEIAKRYKKEVVSFFFESLLVILVWVTSPFTFLIEIHFIPQNTPTTTHSDSL